MIHVCIVDDDPGIRDGLSLLLGVHGYQVRLFGSAESFLSACRPDWRGCALIDIRMTGMGGLELQRKLVSNYPALPVVIITGHANVAAARVALTGGAVDFLVKPISEVELLEAIKRASSIAEDRQAFQLAQQQWQLLTNREQEILNLLIDGQTSREIGKLLGITHRTVETYKSRMMDRLGARKPAELLNMGMLVRASHKLS